MLKVALGGGASSRPDELSPCTRALLNVQALPLVLRLKSDCPNARFVYASQSQCATAHRDYKADKLPQVLIFKDGALVAREAPSGGSMRWAFLTLTRTQTPALAPVPPQTPTCRPRHGEHVLADPIPHIPHMHTRTP